MADRDQLQPGEKQPPHPGPDEIAQGTVDALRDFSENIQATQTYGPSSERAKQGGNLNPVPPHEREVPRGPAVRNPADIAAGHIAAATTAIDVQRDSQQRIESDPRHERDQRIFAMGMEGSLPLVPPSEAEQATMAARAGVPEEAIDKIPKNAEEQVEEDMKRLDEAQERKQAGTTGLAPVPGHPAEPVTRPGVVKPGEQAGIPKNNLETDAAGRTVGGAEGEAQKRQDQQKTAAEETKANQGNVIR